MTNGVGDLLNEGVALKREGKFDEARHRYMEALKLDPANAMTYISLGKIAYLSEKSEFAISCYIAAMHIELAIIEAQIQEGNLSPELNAMYSQFTEDELAKFPRQSAFVVFLDTNTPRHLAHAMFDINPVLLDSVLEKEPSVPVFAAIYRAHILGDGTYDEVLLQHKMTAQEQMAKNESFYIPFGRGFLMDHIKWDALSSLNVIDLYFS